MANDSEKYIKNAVAQNGKRRSVITNKPTQYTDQNAQYYARQTTRFISERAKYSSDFVKARVQGVFKDDFYRFVTTNIRFADIASETATATKLIDDYKNVLFAEEKISYFPIGAKIETMGSTWLCINPSNISSVYTTAVVQRCNASYNLYDYYGNIITEPIAIQKATMASNSNASGENLVLMDGYFDVTCQLNENTKLLNQNQRLILGSKSYSITGFVDFMQEFTGDYDSVHLLHFTVRIGEPIIDDDLTNHIVDGNLYSFAAEINGNTNIAVGESNTLTAYFVKNGLEVEATDDYPLTWVWESSDESVATVDEDGNVTGISAGTAQITAYLSQNKAISASVDLAVTETQNEPYVQILGVVPQYLSQFETITIIAAYYEDGEQTDNEVTWTLSGADEEHYSATMNGNTLTIYCLSPSDIDLTVTVSYGDYSDSVNIGLLGY